MRIPNKKGTFEKRRTIRKLCEFDRFPNQIMWFCRHLVYNSPSGRDGHGTRGHNPKVHEVLITVKLWYCLGKGPKNM